MQIKHDTAPKTLSATLDPATRAAKLAARPAHPLLDQLVSLKDGTTGTSYYQGGANVVGSTLKGYVWIVKDGVAVVDFGKTSSGVGLRVTAKIEDLEVVK